MDIEWSSQRDSNVGRVNIYVSNGASPQRHQSFYQRKSLGKMEFDLLLAICDYIKSKPGIMPETKIKVSRTKSDLQDYLGHR